MLTLVGLGLYVTVSPEIYVGLVRVSESSVVWLEHRISLSVISHTSYRSCKSLARVCQHGRAH